MVASIADKVTVMYAGEVLSLVKVERIFYDQNIHTHGACFQACLSQPRNVDLYIPELITVVCC